MDVVSKIKVFYDKNDVRKIRCFCGKTCKITIVPHLRKEHPREWERWRVGFVRLRNKGWSYKRIMWKYRVIFSWSVIEREIRKVVEEGKAQLIIKEKGKISEWEPVDPCLQTTTVWDFPERGSWATHTSSYRGNWPPQVPRNLIQKYTKEGDLVFDPFVGGGTTLIEAYLLRRRSVGLDINPVAIKLSKSYLAETEAKTNQAESNRRYRPIVKLGDARKSVAILRELGISEGFVDLVCAHPPYLDAIRYTEKVDGDLSHIKDHEFFCDQMQEIAEQLYSLLRTDGICSVLIGDKREGKILIPLGFKMMERFLKDNKFALEEIIMKTQHNDESSLFYRNKASENYLLAHEYLFVFRKIGGV